LLGPWGFQISPFLSKVDSSTPATTPYQNPTYIHSSSPN
jgi:hypothetical protein